MLPLIYGELRRLAHSYLRRERSDHTLQPTALVHEAYLRLASQHNLDWDNRVQVMAMAAAMMRRVIPRYPKAPKTAHEPRRGGPVAFFHPLPHAAEHLEVLWLHSSPPQLVAAGAEPARG